MRKEQRRQPGCPAREFGDESLVPDTSINDGDVCRFGRAELTPKIITQIRFVEWTAGGRLRHAASLGLRSDKRELAVQRET